MEQSFLEPFLYGLGVGTLGVVGVYMREALKRSAYKKEIKSLKGHLYQKMDIESEATEMKRKEIEMLKKENENLRITNQALAQKPDRKEVMTLYAYQKAIDQMSGSLVGFAPAWQRALKESEEEIAAIEEGKKSFVKKIIPLQFWTGITSRLNAKEDHDDRDKPLFE